MPRYIRANATNRTTIAVAAQIGDPCGSALDARCDQQRDASVDRDRRGRVPGRVAGVHGQLLEPMHLRAVPVDDERRRTIGPGLDCKRQDQKARQAPVSCDRGHNEGHTGDDWQDDAAGHDRADERRVSQSARPVPRQEADQRLVVVRCAVDVQDDARHEQAEEDRETGDRREGDQHATRYVQTGWPSPGSVASRRPTRPAPRRAPGTRGSTRANYGRPRRGGLER